MILENLIYKTLSVNYILAFHCQNYNLKHFYAKFS